VRAKVLLVFPPFTKPALLDYAPIGICQLASYLKREIPDAEVKLVDGTNTHYSNGDWQDLLLDYQPDLVGISCITLNYPSGKHLATLASALLPATLTVMGGVHVVTTLQESLQYCDVVVTGEGEDVLCELARGWPLEQISGIGYKNRGCQVFTKPRPQIADLDSLLFPDYAPLNPKSYVGYPAWQVLTSRGCPYDCSFCTNHVMWGRKIRSRSPKNIVGEIQELHDRYGINRIQFQDDTVNIPQARAFAVCDEIINRGLNKEMTFMASLRVNKQLVSQEMLNKMKEAGFEFLGFGVESGSQRVLDIMHKELAPQEVKSAVKMMRKAGIKRRMGFIMIGNWGETLWDVFKTWWLTITTSMETAYSVCTPFPGTEFYKLCVKAGYLSNSPDWEDFNITTVTTRTDKMGKRAIFAVHVASIFLQLVFAIFRGGSPRRTLHKIWWHGVDMIRRRLSLEKSCG